MGTSAVWNRPPHTELLPPGREATILGFHGHMPYGCLILSIDGQLCQEAVVLSRHGFIR